MDEFSDYEDIADEDLFAAESEATKATSSQVIQNGSGIYPTNGFSRTASRPHSGGHVVVIDLDDRPDDVCEGLSEIGNGVASRPARRPASARSLGQSPYYKQTTLFGNAVTNMARPPVQRGLSRPFRADLRPETPTHHELNHDELKRWVYPTNLGPIRSYQYTIVKKALYNNTLVALPTGLGKTFIAATVMLNFFRWTKKAKIIFVAPTKPLASQQVEACLSVAGVPKSQATLLTGETQPVIRESEWGSRRLFFMTPQTLMNDLSKGYADPKSVVLLVVDEAHRATGDYAYVKVVQFIRRFSNSFRILALTATPGSNEDSVQEVIANLEISHVEVRTEESLDLRPYVHKREIEKVILQPSDEMLRVGELFSKALKPISDKLSGQNIYANRDVMKWTTFGLLQRGKEWMAGPAKHAQPALVGMMRSVFAVAQSLAHAIKLLNFHGIKPFYDTLLDFQRDVEDQGDRGGKLKRQVASDENFQQMMGIIAGWLKNKDFVAHPKVAELSTRLLNHFMDAGEGNGTRAIVFAEYRASAEEIVQVLNRKPMIRATVFVGQSDSRRSAGMTQKAQIDTIQKFKNGEFNVLVATSIGEEGLDIGQVDLVVCFDASGSPLRMLQRMGRTGRKRAGNIVALLMKGVEEDKFEKAKDSYSSIQKSIENGDKFQLRHDLSSRILPRDAHPAVDKRHVEIPMENTQDPSLPEPKKTKAALRKKAAKKLHMPDGVETGFQTLTAILARPAKMAKTASENPVESDILAEVPSLGHVVLSKADALELGRRYRSTARLPDGQEEVEPADLSAHAAYQRTRGCTSKIKHGEYTKRAVRLFRTLGNLFAAGDDVASFCHVDPRAYRQMPVPPFAEETDGNDDARKVFLFGLKSAKRQRGAGRTWLPPRPPQKTATEARSAQLIDSDDDESEEGSLLGPCPSATPRPGKRRGKDSSKRRRRGIRGTRDNLEDYGDDCHRTSDLESFDGSDSGADLADWVVDDDVASSMLRRTQNSNNTPDSPRSSRSSARTSSPLKSAAGQTQQPTSNRFYEPVTFASPESTDQEIPDLEVLLGKAKAHGSFSAMARRVRTNWHDIDMDDREAGLDKCSDGKPVARPGRQQKQRLVIQDSDDDDDD